MSSRRESLTLQEHRGDEKVVEPAGLEAHARGRQFSLEPQDVEMVHADQQKLKRNLKGRHMQMIAM